jgi:DNA-binding transcriptional MocR family regulator
VYVVPSSDLVGLLGQWSSNDAPLNQLLAGAIAEAITRGDLPKGCRLPSERHLAASLGVSRTTISLAYDRLRSRGLLLGRGGAGTRVSLASPASLQPGSRRSPLGDQPRLGAEDHPDLIELTVGALEGSPLVAEAISEVAGQDAIGLMDLRGYLPMGLPKLRERVAGHMSRLGVPTTSEQILVTTGAQQALDLLARHYAAPEASVLLENPTYLGAIDAFRAARMRLVPLAMDQDGLRVDLARNASFAVGPQLLYVMPNSHNPTGVTLSEQRRSELADLAQQNGLVVVEDLSPDLAFGLGLPAPIAAFDRAGRVVSVGSFNKLFWGGLRVGWVRGPTELIEQLGSRKITSDHATSVLTQAVAVRLLERLDEQALIVQALVHERRNAVTAALTAHLPEWTWREPSGGISLWVRLPFGNAADVAQLAERYGVIVRPGSLFSPSGGFQDHIRIPFGQRPDRLEQGVARLALAWGEYRQMTHRRRVPSLTVTV